MTKKNQTEELDVAAEPEEPEAEAAVAAEEPEPEEAPEASAPKGQTINGDAMLVDGSAIITEDARSEPGDGEVVVVYRGLADAFEHGGRTYRPDQPTIVSSDVAEDLLTYPNEQFEVKG